MSLLEAKPVGVPWDEAVEALARIFEAHAHDAVFEIKEAEDQTPAARKEMRYWMRLGLVVERDGNLMATDALERALYFLADLEERTMTSTASRLATVELDRMKERLRAILQSEEAPTSLNRKQRHELRTLIGNLVDESRGVLHARSRSERDVRSFLQSGLADEQVRVGAVLQELFKAALDVD